MPHTLFISDLHLAADTPEANDSLLTFLRETAPAADALYVLGDLFEYWVGDDMLTQPFSAGAALCGLLSNRRICKRGYDEKRD